MLKDFSLIRLLIIILSVPTQFRLLHKWTKVFINVMIHIASFLSHIHCYSQLFLRIKSKKKTTKIKKSLLKTAKITKSPLKLKNDH